MRVRRPNGLDGGVDIACLGSGILFSYSCHVTYAALVVVSSNLRLHCTQVMRPSFCLNGSADFAFIRCGEHSSQRGCLRAFASNVRAFSPGGCGEPGIW